mmetsp:Transcript_17736/g.42543  ORF Transcript_17736/g.42543 Transcript_17736/m.42543 type:complete len:271 (-) Transcript_17736:338-1150(-)
MAALAQARWLRKRVVLKSEEDASEPSVTFVETDADGNTQVYLFTTPPPADLYCPLSREILSDPVLTPYGHTFSRASILERIRSTGRCPVTGKLLSESQLSPNLLARTLVDELEVFCPYGIRLEGGSWVEDEDGCPDTFKLSLRKAKLKACKYRPTLCPYGGRKCGLIPRIDLDTHARDECQHLHRGGAQAERPDAAIDTLEALTVLLAWGLLVYGVSQTQLFGRLVRSASWQLSLLMGIPVTLLFVAVLLEYALSLRRPVSPDDDDFDDD